MLEIANTSAHAMELLDERDRLCGDLPADSERRFRDALARVFRRAAQTGEVDLAALVRVFVAGLGGAKRRRETRRAPSQRRAV